MKVLVLVLALAPQVLVLALTLRKKSWPTPILFFQNPGHMAAVGVYSAHTHGVI